MKIRIYSLMIGLFILGVASGVLLTLGVAKQQIRELSGSSTSELTGLVTKFLDRRLKLSDEQQTAVSAVLTQGEADVLPIRREFRQKMFEVVETYHPQINAHLDTSQQGELNLIVDRLLSTWQLGEDPDPTSIE